MCVCVRYVLHIFIYAHSSGGQLVILFTSPYHSLSRFLRSAEPTELLAPGGIGLSIEVPHGLVMPWGPQKPCDHRHSDLAGCERLPCNAPGVRSIP